MTNNQVKSEGKRKRIYGPTKQKILLLLATGLALGLQKTTIGQQVKIIQQAVKEWSWINRHYLSRCLREFRDDRLVEYDENDDGNIKIVLSEQGEKRVLQFKIDQLILPKLKHWDDHWRIVLYDIPEKNKPAREALREKLKELGFYEWQKSVFIFPFPCRDEIDFLIEFFEIRSYVRYAELSNPTNEAELKLHFEL